MSEETPAMSEETKEPSIFIVEYEIPPMRAIWSDRFSAHTVSEIHDYIEARCKKWFVRKIRELSPYSSKEIIHKAAR